MWPELAVDVGATGALDAAQEKERERFKAAADVLHGIVPRILVGVLTRDFTLLSLSRLIVSNLHRHGCSDDLLEMA